MYSPSGDGNFFFRSADCAFSRAFNLCIPRQGTETKFAVNAAFEWFTFNLCIPRQGTETHCQGAFSLTGGQENLTYVFPVRGRKPERLAEDCCHEHI